MTFTQAYTRFRDSIVVPKRTRIIPSEIQSLLADCGSIDHWLDIGSREGAMTSAVKNATNGQIKQVSVVDIDFYPENPFPCIIYDGCDLPFKDNSFDLVSFIDVLHHTNDVEGLVKEASRVSRRFVLIKDHLSDGLSKFIKLCFVDWLGNVGTPCPRPYNFLPPEEWNRVFDSAGLSSRQLKPEVDLEFPRLIKCVFPSSLHFVGLLECGQRRDVFNSKGVLNGKGANGTGFPLNTRNH